MFSRGRLDPNIAKYGCPYYILGAASSPPPPPPPPSGPVVSGVVARHRKGLTYANYVDVEPDVTKCGSMVVAIIILFSQNVTVSAGAFTLTSQPSGVSAGGVSFSNPTTLTAFVSANSVRLTYFGLGDSIPDGIWKLTIDMTKVSGPTYSGTGTHEVNEIRRLYGDLDNNSTVDGDDNEAFGNAYGSSEGDPNFQAAFDYNNDGIIGADDLETFGNNFGISL